MLSGGNGGAGPKDTTRRVAGKAVTVASVCGGGAAISREQIARLPPPRPIPGREFLVVAGEQITAAPPAARFTTRPDGTFATRLPLGTWCVFDAARRLGEPPGSAERPVAARAASPASPEIDAACLAAEKRRCDPVLTVRGDVIDANITFTQQCSQPWNQPCYRGPMPP